LPIVVQSLADRFEKLRRNVPIFRWSGKKLKVEFQRMKL